MTKPLYAQAKDNTEEEAFADTTEIDADIDMSFDNASLERYGKEHQQAKKDKQTTLHGFVEYRVGLLSKDHSQQQSINEVRLQTHTKYFIDNAMFFAFKGDLLHDARLNKSKLELRESYLFMRPHPAIDIKLGRQIVSWGTGDSLYFNDFSPKSWTSSFIGRGDEDAKLPSDALRINAYNNKHHLDLVTNLRFRPDEIPQGERFSGNHKNAENKDDWFDKMTYALRYTYENKDKEYSLYAYRGYWTTPSESVPANRYARLNAYGASVQGNLGKGISNIEIAYYDSVDNVNNKNPLINSSRFRTLVGYEQEVATNFSVGIQALYDRIEKQADQQLYTLRLTKSMLQQTLKLSSFSYYSPTAEDSYTKLNLDYRYNDNWTLYTGANIFSGKKKDTFFGSMQDNSNIFLGLRYHY